MTDTKQKYPSSTFMIRAIMFRWQNGRQLVLRPDFKKSDKNSIGVKPFHQHLLPLIMGVDHGGNERVVNVSKELA